MYRVEMQKDVVMIGNHTSLAYYNTYSKFVVEFGKICCETDLEKVKIIVGQEAYYAGLTLQVGVRSAEVLLVTNVAEIQESLVELNKLVIEMHANGMKAHREKCDKDREGNHGIEGPYGGAFSSWDDYYSYKEGSNI